MKFDAKSIKPIEWGVIGGGGLSFIALFLPWFGASFGPYSATISGWSTTYGWLGGLLAFAAGVWYFLYKSQVQLPTLPVSTLVVTFGAAALGFLIVLIRWISLPRSSALGKGFSYGGRFGIWVALVAALAEVVCTALLFRQSGEALPWKNSSSGSMNSFGGPSGGMTSAPPAPPSSMAPPPPPPPPAS